MSVSFLKRILKISDIASYFKTLAGGPAGIRTHVRASSFPVSLFFASLLGLGEERPWERG